MLMQSGSPYFLCLFGLYIYIKLFTHLDRLSINIVFLFVNLTFLMWPKAIRSLKMNTANLFIKVTCPAIKYTRQNAWLLDWIICRLLGIGPTPNAMPRHRAQGYA